MSADDAFKVAYELWICVAVLSLGLGPGIAIVRACRLPASCWLPVTLSASCALAYGVFWIYVADVNAGRLAAVVCWCASVAWFIWSESRPRATPLLRERDAWLPGLLLAVLTTAYLCLLQSPNAPIDYYLRHMPPDNTIPRKLADRFDPPVPLLGPRPHFLLADWLGSDRPPLQSAVLLAARPFASHLYPDLTDEAVGVICQMGWLLALYALGRRLGLTRRQAGYMFVGCACSAFFLTNSLYIWPKLLAAWLFLLALTIILHMILERQAPLRLTLLATTLFALSMLSHGGSLFALLALPVLAGLYRAWRLVPPRHLVAAVIVGLAVLAPWMAYQRLVDPPGNRLLKAHLAGVGPIDSRGTLETIVDQYSTLTVGQYLYARWANVRTQFQLDLQAPGESWTDWIRRLQFFHHLWALDALAIGFLGLWWSDRTAHVRKLLLYTLAAIGVWCVLMFDPGATIIHHGGYAVTMLLFVCAAVGLAELPRAARAVVLATHVALFGLLWIVPRDVDPASAAVIARNASTLVSVALLVAFAAMLRMWPSSSPTPSTRSGAPAASTPARSTDRPSA